MPRLAKIRAAELIKDSSKNKNQEIYCRIKCGVCKKSLKGKPLGYPSRKIRNEGLWQKQFEVEVNEEQYILNTFEVIKGMQYVRILFKKKNGTPVKFRCVHICEECLNCLIDTYEMKIDINAKDEKQILVKCFGCQNPIDDKRSAIVEAESPDGQMDKLFCNEKCYDLLETKPNQMNVSMVTCLSCKRIWNRDNLKLYQEQGEHHDWSRCETCPYINTKTEEEEAIKEQVSEQPSWLRTIMNNVSSWLFLK